MHTIHKSFIFNLIDDYFQGRVDLIESPNQLVLHSSISNYKPNHLEPFNLRTLFNRTNEPEAITRYQSIWEEILPGKDHILNKDGHVTFEVLIRTWHARLTSDQNPSEIQPSSYRTTQAYCGSYALLPPEDILEAMNAWCALTTAMVQSTDTSISLAAMCAFLSSLFLWIHPFSDGNGRCARLLVYALSGLQIAGTKRHRRAWITALREHSCPKLSLLFQQWIDKKYIDDKWTQACETDQCWYQFLTGLVSKNQGLNSSLFIFVSHRYFDRNLLGMIRSYQIDPVEPDTTTTTVTTTTTRIRPHRCDSNCIIYGCIVADNFVCDN